MSQATHRVLIIGVGSIGERHLRCFLKTGRAVLGFVETRTEQAAELRGRYPQVLSFSSLGAALEQTWDVAVIATPAPLHIPQALDLIRRQIHLLIEKPLGTSLEQVDELQSARLQSSSVCGVAYVYRAHPVLAEMRAAIQTGEFGRPVQLIANCGQNFPTYRPSYDRIYYADRKLGGGAVQDALTHIVNLGEWFVGPIEKVVSDLGHLVLPRVTVEDTVHVLARHGAVLANYSLNQHQAPNEITFTIVCEHGTLRYEHHLNRWRVMTAPESPWQDFAFPPMERDEWFLRQANSFLDAVEGKSQPLCSVEDALNTLKVNLAILRSAETQMWCQVSSLKD